MFGFNFGKTAMATAATLLILAPLAGSSAAAKSARVSRPADDVAQQGSSALAECKEPVVKAADGKAREGCAPLDRAEPIVARTSGFF